MLEQEREQAEHVFGGSVEISRSQIHPFDKDQFETQLRSQIAKIVIYSFLVGIGIIVVGVPIHNLLTGIGDTKLDFFDTLTAYSGILGPFVGVIAGYYFKG